LQLSYFYNFIYLFNGIFLIFGIDSTVLFCFSFPAYVLFLPHSLVFYFTLTSVLSACFRWMPLSLAFPTTPYFPLGPVFPTPPHSHSPSAFPAVIRRISACSQLIAAQQLIVITDTCGTPTPLGSLPTAPGKSPPTSPTTLNPPVPPPIHPIRPFRPTISLTGCSGMPFVCLRF